MPDGIGYPGRGPAPGGAPPQTPGRAIPGGMERPATPGTMQPQGQFGPFKEFLRAQFNSMPPAEQMMVANAIMMAPRQFAKLVGPEFLDFIQQMVRMTQGGGVRPAAPAAAGPAAPMAAGPARPATRGPQLPVAGPRGPMR